MQEYYIAASGSRSSALISVIKSPGGYKLYIFHYNIADIVYNNYKKIIP